MGRAHDEAIDAEIRAMPRRRREPKKTPCELTTAQKLEIEARIVEGLNAAWPESHGDEQTWSDKREAIENEVKTLFPVADEKALAQIIDDMQQNYVARPLPYVKMADDVLHVLAPKLVDALKRAHHEHEKGSQVVARRIIADAFNLLQMEAAK